jgi:hypothetical protein
MEILIATLISCSDIQGIMETVRADKYLTSEVKTEIVEMLIQGTPQCELNEGSELS